MSQSLGSRARELSRPYYDEALPAHDIHHANRVRELAGRLAAAHEDTVDGQVLAAAAWFHDIGRPRERTGAIDDHGEWAADEAASLLDGVSAERIDAIRHCLRAHSIRSSSPTPATPEAKLLFDADKLDALGARGLVRLACIVGERSGRAGEGYAVLEDTTAFDATPADSPDVSLLREWARERRDALYTEPGRRVGASRWAFVETFFERFEAEAGEREPE